MYKKTICFSTDKKFIVAISPLFAFTAHNGDGGHAERLSLRRAPVIGWKPGK